MAEQNHGVKRDGVILVCDSGLGGLSVLRAAQDVPLDAHYIYAADNAGFPYGAWDEVALKQRLMGFLTVLIERYQPDIAVIACNTASTLVLKDLRARFDIPFVGTVPAIRVAARNSTSRIIGVLATRATVKRDYTHDLIAQFGEDCEIMLCASDCLAAMAEDKLGGGHVDMAQLALEIAPAFVERDGARTDTIVLACTHYPFLLDELKRAAPWEVDFIDPAPAIAHRLAEIFTKVSREDREASGQQNLAVFTAEAGQNQALRKTLSSFDLHDIEICRLPEQTPV